MVDLNTAEVSDSAQTNPWHFSGPLPSFSYEYEYKSTEHGDVHL